MTVEEVPLLDAGAWTGCVAVVAATAGMTLVAESAAGVAARVIAGDAVFGDICRIRVSTALAGTDGDATGVQASALRRALLDAAVEDGEAFAPRLTFTVVLVHQDPDQARSLLETLADDETLATLPISFRFTGRPSPQDEAEDAIGREIAGLVLQAAAQIETSPDHVIDVAQVRALRVDASWSGRGTGAGPAWAAAVEGLPPGSTSDESRVSAGVRWLEDLAERTVLRPRPPGTVDVINDLAASPHEVRFLYVVLVTDTTRPTRRERDRRREVAAGILRAALGDDRRLAGVRWYARVLTASQHATEARVLAESRHVREKDMVWPSGEFLDLEQCIDDLRDIRERDEASFARRRRQVTRPATVVLFLGAEPPVGGPDAADCFARLCSDVRVSWVLLHASPRDVSPDFDVPGTYLQSHADVVDEVIATVLTPDPVLPGPDEDAPDVPPAQVTLPESEVVAQPDP